MLRPRASGAFTPKSVTSLALWLDASDSSTLYDSTSGGSLVAADGTVGRWEDKSGNGRHATQSTANNRPTRKVALLNGLDGVYFNGSPFTMSTATFTVPSAFTLYVVQRNTTQFQTNVARCVEHGSVFTTGWNAVGASLGMANGSYLWQARFNTTTFDTAKSTASANYLIAYNSDGAATKNLSLSFNGGTASTFTSAASPTGAYEFWINSLAGAFYHSIQNVHEIVYYDRLLTAAEQSSVASYLNKKWAVY